MSKYRFLLTMKNHQPVYVWGNDQRDVVNKHVMYPDEVAILGGILVRVEIEHNKLKATRIGTVEFVGVI